MRASRSASRLPPRSGGCFAAAPALATAIPVPADATRHPGLVGWGGRERARGERHDQPDRRMPLRRCPVPAHRSSLRGRLLPLPFVPQAHRGSGLGLRRLQGRHRRVHQGRTHALWTSPGVRRGFCARCGSTLTYETDALPGEIHVHIGALDRPEDFSASRQGVLCGRARSVAADQGGGWGLDRPQLGPSEPISSGLSDSAIRVTVFRVNGCRSRSTEGLSLVSKLFPDRHAVTAITLALASLVASALAPARA